MSLPQTNQPEIFRGIDPITSDWRFGQGLGSYATGQSAIMLDVRTALLMFKNDWFLDLSNGIDWLTFLGNRGTQNAILVSTRKVIASRWGVVAINSLSVSLDSVTRNLSLIYSLSTIFSKIAIDAVEVAVPITPPSQ